MCNIDYIMDLLDWNKSIVDQTKGRELAREVKSINVFLQPCDVKHNKNVWDNCAKILSDRTDEELAPYLIELMEWVQDLNWPGALCILDRLKNFENNKTFNFYLNFCLKRAKALNEDIWLDNLQEIIKQT